MRTAVRKRYRSHVVRRAAFLLEAADRVAGGMPELPGPDARLPVDAQSSSLLAVVAHWRDPTARGAEQREPLSTCLRSLLDLGVGRVEIVIVTNDVKGAARDVASINEEGESPAFELQIGVWAQPSEAKATITVERWRPRGLQRHGFFLTWHHKRVFRRAGRAGRFTHLLYLEDDIAFTAENFRYWLAARAPFHTRGLIPGFIRFERKGDTLLLSDQARTGQHADGGEVDVPGFPETALRVSRRPYQAMLLLDAPLIEYHLRRSPMRSPLRSNVVKWDLRERACAGEMFGPTEGLMRAILRPDAVRTPPSRHGVLVEVRDGGRQRPIAAACIEHLRPTASLDPTSSVGTVRVEDF